jgi:hypothetical protein
MGKDIDESRTGWIANKQKLICLMALNDEVAQAMSSKAGEAFFRAFIVEERDSGNISCKFRYRYTDGGSWYTIELKDEEQKKSRAERVAKFQETMEEMILKALEHFGGVKPPRAVFTSHFPPDDGGDWQKTIDWLVKEDLIHQPRAYDKEGNLIR